jgi:hypothetical protein
MGSLPKAKDNTIYEDLDILPPLKTTENSSDTNFQREHIFSATKENKTLFFFFPIGFTQI